MSEKKAIPQEQAKKVVEKGVPIISFTFDEQLDIITRKTTFNELLAKKLELINKQIVISDAIAAAEEQYVNALTEKRLLDADVLLSHINDLLRSQLMSQTS